MKRKIERKINMWTEVKKEIKWKETEKIELMNKKKILNSKRK